jgi:hypothetical protein
MVLFIIIIRYENDWIAEKGNHSKVFRIKPSTKENISEMFTYLFDNIKIKKDKRMMFK